MGFLREDVDRPSNSRRRPHLTLVLDTKQAEQQLREFSQRVWWVRRAPELVLASLALNLVTAVLLAISVWLLRASG